jgi:hypothetical protein
MRFDHLSFGTIRIDGSTCQHDVVIDRGKVRKRKKGPSKQFSNPSGHTPLSIEEKIPWKCRQLIIGTGAYGRLPVMKEVKREAERRKVALVVLPTRADEGRLAARGLRRFGRFHERNLLGKYLGKFDSTPLARTLQRPGFSRRS